MKKSLTELTLQSLAKDIKQWGADLGFDDVGITDTDVSQYTDDFLGFLQAGFHGEMEYLAKNCDKRFDPAKLVPNTVRIISIRMNYLVNGTNDEAVLADPKKAYVARYALGRDYHKVLRKRLQQLAKKIQEAIGDFGYRAFTDSAPVLEGPIAEKAGLGWTGKHTLLLNRKAGSWFFLGELFTDLPLPVDPPETKNHCGSCTRCIDVCPTQAIVGPKRLDARRCISYLTIEYKGEIPHDLRPLIGNRIYGCDDCQLFCPWNRFARMTEEPDFMPRHGLADLDLVDAFLWTEDDFDRYTQGSAIRRVGYVYWLRNVAVALGNGPRTERVLQAVQSRYADLPDLVKKHLDWCDITR